MTEKKFTYGDGLAVMVLAGLRMGFNPGLVDIAKDQLNGKHPHPMHGSALEKEAGALNGKLFHDAALIAKANVHAEIIKAEYGFVSDVSKEAFLELQDEAESLEMDNAMGHDLPEHPARLEVIDRIMNAASWTLHPDYGCVKKTDVSRMDAETLQQG